MYQLAWTYEQDQNQFCDFWSMHETKAEAEAALKDVWAEAYCWAISKVLQGSEPHYSEQQGREAAL